MRFKKGMITFVVLMLICSTHYFISNSRYKLSEKYSDFPIPKSAKLLIEDEEHSRYKWNKSSDINGIPLSYRLIIATNGWKKEVREGTLTTYEKDGVKINFNATLTTIEIDKVNKEDVQDH
ncbi:hypothetical protein ACE38V_13885 [Cytobacillus sp. Hz8]|uniref:hypothetical protein n=1 Tax=Cytobacillus sp. Hz8 TaxID=3347168 RepID=UPI0035E0123F